MDYIQTTLRIRSEGVKKVFLYDVYFEWIAVFWPGL